MLKTMLQCFNVMIHISLQPVYALLWVYAGSKLRSNWPAGPDARHPQADDTLLLEQRNLLDLINKLESGLGQVDRVISRSLEVELVVYCFHIVDVALSL
jgi:hypothetical protein